MTRDRRGRLYVAANPVGEVIRVDPETKDTCVIASGLMLTSSVRFGQDPAGNAEASTSPGSTAPCGA